MRLKVRASTRVIAPCSGWKAILASNAMYGRGGKPLLCGSAIQKAKISGLIGRPTHFCPRCQPCAQLAEAVTPALRFSAHPAPAVVSGIS